MAKLTHKSLYELVKEEIVKNGTYNTKSGYSNQLSRSRVASANPTTEVNVNQILSSIQTFLSDALPSFIRTGLTVTANDPIDDTIIVAAGSGAAAGFLYELDEAVELTIPFDSTTEVYYINLESDNIQIEKTEDPKKLTVAKIVVPNPGVTSRVRDKKDDSDDAYIMNYKEYKLHGDANGIFEEDTIELLRDNIGAILADNIIGNIRLSENLKIINTLGTLEMDSQELRILDLDGNTIARFNKDGTFFYDSTGTETAHFSTDSAAFGDFELVDGEVRIYNGSNVASKFTSDGVIFYNSSGDIVGKFAINEANIGNIDILSNAIQSSNFVEGSSGFRIKDDGTAEFEHVIIRGVFSTSVFQKDTVSAIGGHFLIANSDVLDVDMTALDSSTLTIAGNATFSVGDILRIKDENNDEWLEVTNISSAPTYTVTRDKSGAYSSNNNPVWTAGHAVVSYGGSGSGVIYMTASEAQAPYFNILTHEGSPWNDTTERLRIGRLNGFLDYDESGDGVYGIAIGELTKYLKYDPENGLRLRGNFTMDSGSIGGTNGWSITTNEIIGSIYSSLRGGQTGYAEGAGFFLGYDSTVSGEDPAYKFSIGDLDNWLKWNGETLSIKGSITLDTGSSIGAGVITADSFVDTVTGDLSVGAVFAKKTIEPNIKWTEYQTEALLDAGQHIYSSGINDDFETSEGLLQIPTSDRWDESGEEWDDGSVWDQESQLGEFTFISGVKDVGANFNQLPIMTAIKNVDEPNTVEVTIAYSEDNVTWSDYQDAYPSELNGVTTWYFSNIVKCRYLKYKIVFTITDGSNYTNLEDIYFKTLAVYKTVIYPDIVYTGVSDANRIITGLENYFSKEYTISFQVQGSSSLYRGQVVTKSNPPSTLETRIVNESNSSVVATADITLIGY